MKTKNAKTQDLLTFDDMQARVAVQGPEGGWYILPCHVISGDEKKKEVSCYIPSEKGKHFSVKFPVTRPTCPIRVTLYLDGKRTASYIRSLTEQQKDLSMGFKRTSSTTRRPFVFSPLQVTDDDNYLDSIILSSNASTKIGEIPIEVHRLTYVLRKRVGKEFSSSEDSWEDSSSYDSDSESSEEDIPDVQKIHEKSAKATWVPHQIAYGEKQKNKRPNRNSSGNLRSKKIYTIQERLATFIFRYRPIEILRERGIVPRLPREYATSSAQNGVAFASSSKALLGGEPLMLEQEEMKPEITDNELDEVDEEIKALEAALKEKKRKRQEVTLKGPRKSRVKREPESMVFFVPGNIKGIIDLT